MENQQINCPACNAPILVQPGIAGTSLTCPSCGQLFVCRNNPQQGNDLNKTIEFLIPKNIPALISYYLGVFSALGSYLLGIPAIICGIVGIVKAKERGGLGHAVAGILLGIFAPLLLPLIGVLFWFYLT